jgi:hypothetical protein
MDLDVGLMLGWDPSAGTPVEDLEPRGGSSAGGHDLRHLYQAGQVDLRPGSEELQLGSISRPSAWRHGTEQCGVRER